MILQPKEYMQQKSKIDVTEIMDTKEKDRQS